ncbi:dipeptidase [Trinickia sp.]|uniref:dipeptidase n=1 Tax=Trinickia sp. TaxID=2571163 RepID=UPI003F8068CF
MSSERVQTIIRRALVWDNHGCMPLRADDTFLGQLQRYRSSGYNVVSLNAGYDIKTIEETIRVLAHFRHWVKRHPDDYLLIDTVDDVLRAKESGQLGVSFDLEGTVALGDQISMIELYYDLGVRWMLMAYNKTNSVGGGCQDEDTGLTAFGRQVLDEMRRVGMVPCCSHTGWKTAREVIAYVDGPVIFSHSNAYEVFGHHRNIPDDLIKACAASGGVIGLNGVSRFIGKTSDVDHDNSTEALFRHLDHMVQLVGPDHVGLALDYVFDQSQLMHHFRSRPDLFPPELGYTKPTPMVEPERLPAIVRMMIDHGYPDDGIEKILGANHLRVARACWK